MPADVPITFTITQFGIRTTLPLLEVTTGRYIAFLRCSRQRPDAVYMKQTLLCLALQRVNAVTEVELQDGLDVYHCSWPQGYHYIQITLELASKLKWKSTDIYISLKPAYRKEQIGPYENIARLQAGSPERPYQLTASIMKRWEEEPGLTLSDARIPPLPWTGSHAIILLFKLDHPRYHRLHKCIRKKSRCYVAQWALYSARSPIATPPF